MSTQLSVYIYSQSHTIDLQNFCGQITRKKLSREHERAEILRTCFPIKMALSGKQQRNDSLNHIRWEKVVDFNCNFRGRCKLSAFFVGDRLSILANLVIHATANAHSHSSMAVTYTQIFYIQWSEWKGPPPPTTTDWAKHHHQPEPQSLIRTPCSGYTGSWTGSSLGYTRIDLGWEFSRHQPKSDKNLISKENSLGHHRDGRAPAKALNYIQYAIYCKIMCFKCTCFVRPIMKIIYFSTII